MKNFSFFFSFLACLLLIGMLSLNLSAQSVTYCYGETIEIDIFSLELENTDMYNSVEWYMDCGSGLTFLGDGLSVTLNFDGAYPEIMQNCSITAVTDNDVEFDSACEASVDLVQWIPQNVYYRIDNPSAAFNWEILTADVIFQSCIKYEFLLESNDYNYYVPYISVFDANTKGEELLYTDSMLFGPNGHEASFNLGDASQELLYQIVFYCAIDGTAQFSPNQEGALSFNIDLEGSGGWNRLSFEEKPNFGFDDWTYSSTSFQTSVTDQEGNSIPYEDKIGHIWRSVPIEESAEVGIIFPEENDFEFNVVAETEFLVGGIDVCPNSGLAEFNTCNTSAELFSGTHETIEVLSKYLSIGDQPMVEDQLVTSYECSGEVYDQVVNVASMDWEEVKIHIVPVKETSDGILDQFTEALPFSEAEKDALEVSLKEIYEQSIVDVKVIVHETINSNYDGFSSSSNSIDISDQNGILDIQHNGTSDVDYDEYSKLLNDLMAQTDIQMSYKNLIVLLLPHEITVNNDDVGGFTQLDAKSAVIAKYTGLANFVRTVAHELGHCFGLKHPAQSCYPINSDVAYEDVHNLMGYCSDQTLLRYFQWKQIREQVIN